VSYGLKYGPAGGQGCSAACPFRLRPYVRVRTQDN
jgi:hypothetical protein